MALKKIGTVSGSGLKKVGTVSSPKSTDTVDDSTISEMISKNFREGLNAVRTEGIVPVARGVNIAAFGALEPLLEKRAPKVADFLFEGNQETVEGKTLNAVSQARGLLSGGAAKLAQKAAGTIKGGGLLASIGRGSVGGATFGATQTPEAKFLKEEGDIVLLKNRAAQAAAGVALGGLLNSVGEKTVQTIRNIKISQGPTSNLQKLKLSIDENLVKLKESLKVDVRTKSEIASQRTQVLLNKVAKENSKIYGQALDDVAANQKIPITRQDVIRAAKDAKQEAVDNFITQGRGIEALDDIIAKYDSGVVKGAKGSFSGKPPSDQNVPLQTVIEDMKSIKNKLTAGARSGAKGFGEDEIPIAILQKNVGSTIEGATDGSFRQLQRTYAPILKAKVKSNTIFKPFKGDFETKQGTNFIERAAQGKLEAGEKRFFDVLKKGNKQFKGIGDVDSEAKAVFQTISKNIDRMTAQGVDIEKVIVDRESFKKFMIGAGIGASAIAGLGGLEKIREAVVNTLR